MKHNWEYKPFGKILKTITPTSKIEKSEYKTIGQFPIISQEDVFISGFWNNGNDITPHSTPVVIFGDHSRVLKYVDFEFVVGADGVKIIQPIGSLNAKFVYHFLKWYNVPSLGYSRHFKLLKEANYPVPPMEVQERIVAELDQINDLIAKNRELLSQLDALAQSLFYDTFGDPISNPKGWVLDVWSNLFDTILGKMLDKAKQDPNDRSIPYLANQNVQWGYFILTNLNEMTFSAKEIDKFKLHIGDILICEGGESGRCAIWEDDQSHILFQKAIHRARIKDRTKLNPYFIRFWLENLKKNDGLKNYITKATIEHLTGAKLKTVHVPLPPLALQEEFAAKVAAIEAQKAKVEAGIAELQTLLDARMDYWFN